MKLSIFTTMTDPESRMDPYREALKCYEEFADEVVIVGEDWPEEFSFDYIGKKFQEGFNKSTGDWVIRMDIDTFFHEIQHSRIKNSKHSDANFQFDIDVQKNIFNNHWKTKWK